MCKKLRATPDSSPPFATPVIKGHFVPPANSNEIEGEHQDIVNSFLDERNYCCDANAEVIAMCLAVGRAALLLREARDELEGRFNVLDIEQLLSTFEPGFYIPREDAALHASLAAHYRWKSLEDVPPGMRHLYDKLRGLTSAQCMALADVLERISHVYLWNGEHKSVASAAAAAGLRLDDTALKD